MQVFDLTNYGNRLANNKRLMTLVAKEFIKESAELVQQLVDYAAVDDWPNVAFIAHRIKGASAEVSGFAMSASANIIERAAKEEDISTIRKTVPQLQSDYADLQQVLTFNQLLSSAIT